MTSSGEQSHESYLKHIEETSLEYPNQKQRKFIQRTTDDFAILQGPPGTGKSLALAHAVLRQSHEWINEDRAKHTLVVAPSHRAVNATMEKVDEYKHIIANETECDSFDSLRLVRVLSRDRGYTPETRTDVEFLNYNNPEEYDDGSDELDDLQNNLAGQRTLQDYGKDSDSFIIFGTPSGGNRIVKKTFDETIRPTFDLFAVDEASMTTITDFVMAGSSTKDGARTLIAGDHRQLSPIQKYDWEREDRRTIRERVPYLSVMDLFRLLSEEDDFGQDDKFDEVRRVGSVEYPIDRLELTYRCDREVARILRELVYVRDGINYRSYLEEDPSYVSDEGPLAVSMTGHESVDTILDPDAPIVVIVHQDSESQQSNALEAGIVDRLVGPIDQSRDDIGVITPHNAQRGRLIDILGGRVPEGTVDTVDRFQGSERDVIILSSTVSDPDYIRKETEFILSPNRLNVALSRMKKKLIVIVSESLIEFIPSDAENYDNARLWKLLLSNVSDANRDEAKWTGDVSALLRKPIEPMPLDTGLDVYTITR